MRHLLTRHDVAAALQCSPRHVSRLVARGELHPVRFVGRSPRFDPGEVYGERPAADPQPEPDTPAIAGEKARKAREVGEMLFTILGGSL